MLPTKYHGAYQYHSDVLCMEIFDQLLHMGEQLTINFKGVEAFSPKRIDINCTNGNAIYFNADVLFW